MMDEDDYEEHVESILSGREGCADEYSSISEFKEHLNDAALAEKNFIGGWVLWRENEEYHQPSTLQIKIKTLLEHVASKSFFHSPKCLVQFWGAVKVEGRHHYLSTSNYPFYVLNLRKGHSWFRKLCMDHVYVVDVDGAEEEQLIGGVGRAYLNNQPESTPDLKLYSTSEFPLRDEAARCRFGDYMALPLYDLHTRKCYGVLEILSQLPAPTLRLALPLPASFNQGLQIVEMRSTHMSSSSTDQRQMSSSQLDNDTSEIREILELAIKAVPQLSLAQVWVPCKECPVKRTSKRCMEMTSLISSKNKRVVSSWYNEIHDPHMSNYIEACEFHNQYMYLTCFFRNISDLSISMSPLAHYARKARLSNCLAICLKSMNNSSNPFVIIQFFLRLKNTQRSPYPSSLLLLLRIIEMKLKSFKLVYTEQLPEELVAQSRQPNAIEYKSIDMLNVIINSKKLSESGLTAYFGTLCCQRPSSEDNCGGWLFCSPVGVRNLSTMASLIKEKIEQFMKIITAGFGVKDLIIQLWIPKMVENRCYLETLDQPYALGSLQSGLAAFREKCMKRRYLVDEEAKEEELGPLGRVFRNEYPEFTNDLYLYSTKEFSMRNYAVRCRLRSYFALPVFDKYEHNCVGVLECIGAHHDFYGEKIERALEVADLRSSRIDLRPRFIAHIVPVPTNITEALTEVKGAIFQIIKIPQLYLAKVWIPYVKSARNIRYMELALTTEYAWQHMYSNMAHWINYVQPKKGMMGMLLESENKSCFCANLSEFSIADQPLAHIEWEKRLDVCFAICLQSSYTGGLLYVLEFFLNPSPGYLWSFFNFLLPIMKHQLQSFKYTCGKQLGEELVVEVIEFREANDLAFSELGHLDVFPFKFKRVQYGQTKHQQGEHCTNVASDPNKTEKGKRKTGIHLNLEDLKSHPEKKLKETAEELRGTAGPSTIKVNSSKEKHAENPSIFQRENEQHSQQDMQASSSSNLRQLETSLHPSVPHSNTESTQHRVVLEEAEKVIIKVELEEDIIKFELCLKLGMAKLFEEVARRLKLEIDSFKLKYLDEDDDEILLTSDADLQYCSKSQNTMGKTYIQLFVRR